MKKVAIVTGSSKGLGLALVKQLQEEGYTVVGISRQKGEDISDLFLCGDITHSPFQEQVIKEVVSRYGWINLLVNNAGVGMYESWEEGSLDEVRAMFELNFFAVISLTNLALPHLKATGGLVVTVSSVAGKISLPYMGAYCASKYALNAYADSLRSELEGSGVDVLNLIVGRVATGFSMRSSGGKTPPHTPGGSDAKSYAVQVMRGIKNRRRQLVFPGWYRYVIAFYTLFTRFFERVAKRKFESGFNVPDQGT